MIQFKKCKGQGKATGYGCGILVNVKNRFYGLGRTCGCYSNWLINSEQGKIILANALNKVQRARLQYENVKDEYMSNKSIKEAKHHTKIVVHAFVRERDKYKPCISCNAEWKDDFQCGHFFKAELFETLKYNLHNLNGQCPRCNLFVDGNVQNYALNLPGRIGQENFDALVKLAEVDKHHQKFWTIEKLKEVRNNIKKLKTQC
jgi:hypothetical protein